MTVEAKREPPIWLMILLFSGVASVGIVLMAGVLVIVAYVFDLELPFNTSRAFREAAASKLPRSIRCMQWREMEPGVIRGRVRCDTWSDGKNRKDLGLND